MPPPLRAGEPVGLELRLELGLELVLVVELDEPEFTEVNADCEDNTEYDEGGIEFGEDVEADEVGVNREEVSNQKKRVSLQSVQTTVQIMKSCGS